MGIIERAYELAGSGQFTTRSKISRAMEKEGFSLAELTTLQGALITKEINRLCKESKAALADSNV